MCIRKGSPNETLKRFETEALMIPFLLCHPLRPYSFFCYLLIGAKSIGFRIPPTFELWSCILFNETKISWIDDFFGIKGRICLFFFTVAHAEINSVRIDWYANLCFWTVLLNDNSLYSKIEVWKEEIYEWFLHSKILAFIKKWLFKSA